MKPTLVVLAAGVGSRFGGLKQLVAIGPGGESLLEYSVYDALRAGFGRVVLVVRPETEPDFRQRFSGGMADRAEIVYAHQRTDDLPNGTAPAGRTKPLGTGHAVLCAEPAVGGSFAVVNADDFYGSEAFESLASFLARGASSEPSAAVVGFEIGRTLSDAGPVARALCELDEAGRLAKIVELEAVWRRDGRIVHRDPLGIEHALSGDELVSMNMWAFDTTLFAELRRGLREFVRESGLGQREFLLPSLIQSAIADRSLTVEVLRARSTWGGVTFRQDQERVTTLLAGLAKAGAYPGELWS